MENKSYIMSDTCEDFYFRGAEKIGQYSNYSSWRSAWQQGYMAKKIPGPAAAAINDSVKIFQHA
ncbi:MAG: hypothetical protein C0613_10365 [Desulfobulbaceae bacterium]|nr:MAG: hypothetical protein C0613_10365 [Desulfobulbaceae bacterium]